MARVRTRYAGILYERWTTIVSFLLNAQRMINYFQVSISHAILPSKCRASSRPIHRGIYDDHNVF